MNDYINDLRHRYIHPVAIHRGHDGLSRCHGGLAEQAGEQRRLQRRELPFQRNARFDGPLRFFQRVVFECEAIDFVFEFVDSSVAVVSWGGQRLPPTFS